MSDFNDLIHDARQVDLEEMIMTNETPMYLVPGRLTDEQDTVIRRNMIGGPILDPADMFALLVRTIGTPIQPCADVETVGYGRETSFTDLKKDGCHGVSIHKEWNGGVPLVRRTDMDTQVAVRDAEIARLREALDRVERIGCVVERKGATTGSHWIQFSIALANVRAALNEGAAG